MTVKRMKFETMTELKMILTLQELDDLRRSEKGQCLSIKDRREIRVFLEQEKETIADIKAKNAAKEYEEYFQDLINTAEMMIMEYFTKIPDTIKMMKLIKQDIGDDGIAYIKEGFGDREVTFTIEIEEIKNKKRKEETEKNKKKEKEENQQNKEISEEKGHVEKKDEMLFYQPIIEEIVEDGKKKERAEKRAEKLGIKFEFKKLNFIIKGEKGLGKTKLAEAIHHNLRKEEKMRHISSSETISKYIGESAVIVREIVKSVQGGTLLVSDFDAWLNQKSDNGNDHALEPMRELLHLTKKKDFTLTFEGTNEEIESIFEKIPEFRDVFYKTIDLPSFQLEHLVELTEFKIKQSNIEMHEESLMELAQYYKENKIKNGHNVNKTVQELLTSLLEKEDGDLKITTKEIKELKEKTMKPKQSETKETFDEAFELLNKLIGQEKAKKEIKSALNLSIVQKKRKEEGKKEIKTTRHMIFEGSPGTGKTTIARIVGKLYASAGLLERGHFVEATIDQLTNTSNVTGKVKQLVNKAEGGILFIDEAYTLLKTTEGREAIDALVPLIENKREDFICILAGYTEDMEQLKNANVGLESRVKSVLFEDYNKEELYEMLENIIIQNEYHIEEEVKEMLKRYVDRNKFNGNGRAMRNLFEKLIEIQANRIVEEQDANYNEIKIADILLLTNQNREVVEV